VYRIKEAVVDEDILPGWGTGQAGPHVGGRLRRRVPAGRADILIMAHPEAIKSVQATIAQLF